MDRVESSQRVLRCGARVLNLSVPQVMGILNVTPDSFSDGGLYRDVESAVSRGLTMVDEGAAVIDIGGESTRPGALSVDVQQELDRVIPVIERLRQRSDVILSIDTQKAEVMRAAVAAGAEFINDVNALRGDGALQTAVESEAAVCLMHMQGMPGTMQANPVYDDVVADIHRYLRERTEACLKAGLPPDRLVVDPGFGFGKTVDHNLALIRRLREFVQLKVPVLVGVSRKSTIGLILDKAVDDRLFGGLGLTAIAIWNGANLIRTHDVVATRDVVRIVTAVRDGQGSSSS